MGTDLSFKRRVCFRSMILYSLENRFSSYLENSRSAGQSEPTAAAEIPLGGFSQMLTSLPRQNQKMNSCCALGQGRLSTLGNHGPSPNHRLPSNPRVRRQTRSPSGDRVREQ